MGGLTPDFFSSLGRRCLIPSSRALFDLVFFQLCTLYDDCPLFLDRCSRSVCFISAFILFQGLGEEFVRSGCYWNFMSFSPFRLPGLLALTGRIFFRFRRPRFTFFMRLQANGSGPCLTCWTSCGFQLKTVPLLNLALD